MSMRRKSSTSAATTGCKDRDSVASPASRPCSSLLGILWCPLRALQGCRTMPHDLVAGRPISATVASCRAVASAAWVSVTLRRRGIAPGERYALLLTCSSPTPVSGFMRRAPTIWLRSSCNRRSNLRPRRSSNSFRSWLFLRQLVVLAATIIKRVCPGFNPLVDEARDVRHKSVPCGGTARYPQGCSSGCCGRDSAFALA